MSLLRALSLYRLFTKLKGDPHMLDTLKSRKFLAAVLTGMLNVVNGAAGFPIPESSIEWLNTLIISWIGTEGVIDVTRTFKSGGTPHA